MTPGARREILLAALIVITLNLLAHFIPFERVSLSGDDVGYLTIPAQERWSYVFRNMLSSPRRPLEVSYTVLHWVVGENRLLWVAPLFLASSLLSVSVYLLMRQLIGQPATALLCATFWMLLPNKVQLYHHLAYTYTHTVLALTVLSFIFFLFHLKSGKVAPLWASVACYALTLFAYELGYFLPLVLAVAAAMNGTGYRVPGTGWRKAAACLLLLLPVALNVLWRSGIPQGGSFHLPPLFPAAFWEQLWAARELYFERPMANWILQGLVRFPTLETPWLQFLLAADAVVLVGFFRWLRKNPLQPIPLKVLAIALAMVVFFLAPAAMGYEVLGRHTPLASMGFSVLAIVALRFLVRPRALLPMVLTALVGAGLMVCQGQAWSQVVSCRMNQAVLETLQRERASLASADRVVIDQHSFAQRIPSSMDKEEEASLDTYWGVDGLAGENFRGMVRWVSGRGIPVEIARSPVQPDGAALRFGEKTVPREGTVLVDYAEVYPRGFHNGRGNPPR